MLPIDDPGAAVFTVGQVADALGVQAAFLRRLDAERLVSPARSSGGQRRYSRDEVDHVQRVWQLAGEGLTLEGIRRLLVLEAEVASLQQQLAEAKAQAPKPKPKPKPKPSS